MVSFIPEIKARSDIVFLDVHQLVVPKLVIVPSIRRQKTSIVRHWLTNETKQKQRERAAQMLFSATEISVLTDARENDEVSLPFAPVTNMELQMRSDCSMSR